FSREVSLGVIVTRPLTTWHYLLPGFFIIDFLRRGSAVRQYTKHFMFPRKLALDAARAIAQGEDETSVDYRIKENIGAWLNSLNLYFPDLVQAHTDLMDVLIDYYLKLLNTEGNSYYLLIKDAYRSRDHYKAFLKKITAAEQDVDRQLIEKTGRSVKVREKILAEQQQVEKRRNKIMDEIFS
ncbi:MAG: NF038143 family protein, partial [Desulfobulbaceae bacterium]|nr:NF038143 family protein [Desulfobulbaceae bacterium]